MRDPLAGPDRSQWATTEMRIGRKPRKYRDKFESMPCSKKSYYINDLSMVVQAVSSELVSASFPCLTGKKQGISPNFHPETRLASREL
jgi:hypothetical protein